MIIAAIGPITLAGNSLGESAPGDLAWLLAILLLMVATVAVLVRAVSREIARMRLAAIIMTIVAVMTLPILIGGALASLLSLAGAPRLRYVLATDAVVGAVLVFQILRSRNPPHRIVSIVTIASGLMVAVGLTRIGIAEWRVRGAIASSPTLTAFRSWDADSAARTIRTTDRPDVFLFILDSYAGDSLLLADYGVDHRAFRDSLALLGFEPPARYWSNYGRTFASVASMLNFAHVASVSGEPLGSLQDASGLHSVITDNRAVRFFQSSGYEVHWLPAPFFGGRWLPPDASTVHRAHGNVFWERWIASMLISTWFERYSIPGALAATLQFRVPVAPAHYSGFADLKVLADDGHPTFAVIHLFATHEPLVYDVRCRPVPSAVALLGLRDAYAAAVRCEDAALLQLFRDLQEGGRDNLIIAAIGDHAPSALRFDETSVPIDSVPHAVAMSRFDVGAFFLVPSRMRVTFESPSSGVNVMPALLHAAFDIRLTVSRNSRYYSQPRPFPIHKFLVSTP
jgi:Sulfatase